MSVRPSNSQPCCFKSKFPAAFFHGDKRRICVTKRTRLEIWFFKKEIWHILIYWNKISIDTTTIFTRNLLGVISKNKLPRETVDTIHLVLAIVRIVIAALWKNIQPTIEFWRKKLCEYFMVGKTQKHGYTEDGNAMPRKCITTWYPVVGYLSGKDVIPKIPWYKDLLYF